MKIVAVTSCPTGIAHTYMAAEAFEQAAKAAGHEVHVETQGSAGIDPLDPADIAAADVVVFAADVQVRQAERFAGKPMVSVGVKRAINDADALVAEAVAAAQGGVTHGTAPVVAVGAPAQVGPGTRLRQWLMTGVSYMIPFVAAGGILIALAFILGGGAVVAKVNGGTWQGVKYPGVTDLGSIITDAGYAGLCFKIGATAFSMLVPILAGFIAFAIADRAGLVPGVVGGLLAAATGAGFLGGLVAGLLAGGVALALARIDVPRAVRGVMPVVVIPLVSSLLVGGLMLVVIGGPIKAATDAMTDGLNSLSGSNKVALGALIGLMMAFDMGGPVNKVAYTFGLASLASGNLNVMAAVMAAGMVPPLALAMATVVRPRLFTEAERHAGEAAWLLGASFVTEGAIPFAAADPLRVIPPIMAGAAVTGATSMAFDVTSRAPHGGIWVTGLVGHPVQFVVAIALGTVVGAVAVVVAKSAGRSPAAPVVTSLPTAAVSA